MRSPNDALKSSSPHKAGPMNTFEMVIPIPDSRYYLWQMLVQITHLRELGYEVGAHYVVGCAQPPSPELRRIFDSPDLDCFIHIYPDERPRKSYSASLKPYLMGRFFAEFPGEAEKTYHYLDPDVLFTAPLDMAPFDASDGRWHGSPAAFYTGIDYLASKGEEVVDRLCAIAGIDTATARAHDADTTGAQYFVAGAGSDFWFELSEKSTTAFEFLSGPADQYRRPDDLPVQAWCAEMYIQQFMTIGAGFRPIADPRLGFLWATAERSEWDSAAYFHNAGLPHENGKDFCKGSWPDSPFFKRINVSRESASALYVDLIKRTEEMFPDLVWE